MVRTAKTRFILTLSPYLKDKLERIALQRGCSQAEVVKSALDRLEEVEV